MQSKLRCRQTRTTPRTNHANTPVRTNQESWTISTINDASKWLEDADSYKAIIRQNERFCCQYNWQCLLFRNARPLMYCPWWFREGEIRFTPICLCIRWIQTITQLEKGYRSFQKSSIYYASIPITVRLTQNKADARPPALYRRRTRYDAMTNRSNSQRRVRIHA